MSRIDQYRNTLHLSDNVEFLRGLPSNSIDSIITDSPYGLGKEPDPKNCIYDWIVQGYHEVSGTGFMGKKWDAFVPQPILWKECYRVLKPGGYLLSFFGTRTYDWGTLAIRWGGFEIKDMISWHYGSGFPKSVNVAKGVGSALKPSTEPICVARKPIVGTLKQNYEIYGTGGINIDECRIPFANDSDLKSATWGTGTNIIGGKYVGSKLTDGRKDIPPNPIGRFPANAIFDESSAAVLDEQSGILKSGKPSGIRKAQNKIYGKYGTGKEVTGYGDIGGASRFFYIAKARQSERINNPHPTVKPVTLMRHLVRLFTPKGGITCDPHMGSGTTCKGCEEWCDYIGIDNDEFSYNIAKNRLNKDNHEA